MKAMKKLLITSLFSFLIATTLCSQQTFTDTRDGQVYEMVKIGDQVWMAENLRATVYPDGAPIPKVTDSTEWSNLSATDSAYCWYNNDSTTNADPYGALYTWAAVTGDSSSNSNPSEIQGVCPDGWHVPSDDEWSELVTFVGNDGHSGSEGTALKATSGWDSDGNGTDDYGFSALPGGYRVYDGGFNHIGYNGYWWSSTEGSSADAWSRRLYYSFSDVSRTNYVKGDGFSVRCLRDSGLFVYSTIRDFDFGGVPVGTTDSIPIELWNMHTQANRVIDSLYIKNNTFSLSSHKDTLYPDDSVAVTVYFTPQEYGDFTDTLHLVTNDPEDPIIDVQIQGSSPAPQIQLDTNTLNFGKVTVDSTEQHTTQIYNADSTNNLTVDELTFSNIAFSSPATLPLYVEPNDTANLTISFTPCEMMNYDDTLTIHNNSGNDSTAEITLSGSGDAIASVYPTPNTTAAPLDTPITITFGRDMDAATINENTFVLHGSYSGKRSGDYSYNSATREAAFTPDKPFDVGEQVLVTLAKGIQTSAGDSLASAFGWSYTTKVQGGTGVFAEKMDYNAGSNPRSVHAADLNGDGHPDLAVANSSSNNISVLVNKGDGTFLGHATYNAGNEPCSVHGADLNSDGHPDLAVANRYSDNVSVLVNRGDGTFQGQTTYNTGNGPHSVYAADLNGDGLPDLAVANVDSDNVSVLLNGGDAAFQGQTTYNAENYPRSVHAADLNGDRHPDLAVANYDSDNVSVLVNRGDGTFSEHTAYNAGNGPYSVHTADLNSDGHTDLAVANYNSDNVSVLLNRGDGTFQVQTTLNTGNYPLSVHAADLDGDGHPDLTVANSSSDNVSVLLSRGDGTFQGHTTFNAGSYPLSVHAADLNSDGLMDLAVANSNSGNISILFNRPQKANLKTSSSLFNFGALAVGETDSMTFNIWNNGTEDSLVIDSLYVPMDAYSLSLETYTLYPDDSVSATLYFQPDSLGDYETTLNIESNDWQEPLVHLPISGYAATEAPCGVLAENTTWDKTGSPYYISCDVAVDADVTLTIEPGVRVLLDTSKTLSVDGILDATGTENDTINFASVKSGQLFNSIKFRSNSTGTLSHFRIKGASRGIMIDHSTPTIRNGLITNCNTGIEIAGASPDIDSMTITKNDNYGIYAYEDNGNASPVITNSTITGNQSYGIYNSCWGHYTEVVDCYIANNSRGIYFQDAYQDALIRGCTIEQNSQEGIYLNEGEPVIEDNRILENEDGFTLSNGKDTDNLIIRNNLIKANTNHGLNLNNFNGLISRNDIKQNQGNGIYLNNTSSSPDDSDVNINKNNLQANANYEVYVDYEATKNIDAKNNYWDYTDSINIADNCIFDYYDNGTSARVDYSPYYTQKVSLTPVDDFTAGGKAGGEVVLQWTLHPKASRYLLYYDNGTGTVDSSSVWQTITDSTQTSFTNALQDGDYRFAIRAEDASGNSSYLSYTSATADGTPPDMLSAEGVTEDSVLTVTFNEPLDQNSVTQLSNWALDNDLTIAAAEVPWPGKELFVAAQDSGVFHLYRQKGTDSLQYELVTEHFLDELPTQDNYPTFGDLDGDGDDDLLMGHNDGKISFYENQGSKYDPDFKLIDTSYQDIDVGSYSAPELGDLDGDGDLDLIIGEDDYDKMNYYENTGSPMNADFDFMSDNYLDSTISRQRPRLHDIDADGDLDIIWGAAPASGQIWISENTGDSTNPNFPSGEELLWLDDYSPAPFLFDIDHDKDLDLFFGQGNNGDIKYYENTGTSEKYNFEFRTDSVWNINVGNKPAPYFINIDNDKEGQYHVNLILNEPLPTTDSTITLTSTKIADSYGNTAGEQSLTFHPDDGNSNPAITVADLSGEQRDSVTINYTITDTEGDTVKLYPRYSTDDGSTWQVATVEGDTTGLDQSLYEGSLIWITTSDIPGVKLENVRFKLIPQDEDPHNTGTPGLTDPFTVNNRMLSSITPEEGKVTTDSSQLITMPYLLGGIDESTLRLQINGSAYSLADNSLQLSSDTLVFDPSVEDHSLHEDSISILLWADDVNSNRVDTCISYFYTDLTAPQVISLTPADGSSTEVNQPDIKVKMTDPVGMINPNTIELEINESSYTLSGNGMTWNKEDSLLTFSPSTAGITFQDQEIVRLSVYAEDSTHYGTPHTLTGEREWDFIVKPGDYMAEVIRPTDSSYTSENTQIIEAALYDTAGVDTSSIIFQLNTNTYDISSKALDFNGYQVSFIPENINLAYPEGTNHAVITAENTNGLAFQDTLNWEFIVDVSKPFARYPEPAPSDSISYLKPEISIYLADSSGIIDTNSIELNVENITYTLSDPGLSFNSVDSILTFSSMDQGVVYADGDTIEVSLKANDYIDYGLSHSLENSGYDWSFRIVLTGDLTHIIKDKNNEGVEDTEIKIYNSDTISIYNIKTNAEGKYNKKVKIGDYSSDVNKEGYNNVYSAFTVEQNKETVVDIALGKVGDINTDGVIDFDDLDAFAVAWNNQDASIEFGPASGTVPDLSVEPDRRIDFEDLMVFTQMWNYTKNAKSYNKTYNHKSERGTADIKWALEQEKNNNIHYTVRADNLSNYRSSKLLVQYDPASIKPEQVNKSPYLKSSESNIQMLTRENKEAGWLEIDLARFGKKKQLSTSIPLADIVFKKLNDSYKLDYNFEIRENTGIYSTGNGVLDRNKTESIERSVVCYPNPARNIVHFDFSIPEYEEVIIELFNIHGTKISTLLKQKMRKGAYSKEFDLNHLKKGIYFYRFKAGGFIQNKKLIIE